MESSKKDGGRESDWRLDLCKHLKGERLQWQNYTPPRKDWDHDHCSACWIEFADNGEPEALHAGYTTSADSRWGANYHWICPKCFDELHELMGWIVVAPPPSGRA